MFLLLQILLDALHTQIYCLPTVFRLMFDLICFICFMKYMFISYLHQNQLSRQNKTLTFYTSANQEAATFKCLCVISLADISTLHVLSCSHHMYIR